MLPNSNIHSPHQSFRSYEIGRADDPAPATTTFDELKLRALTILDRARHVNSELGSLHNRLYGPSPIGASACKSDENGPIGNIAQLFTLLNEIDIAVSHTILHAESFSILA